ncbi:MAG TPA: hypothetical protein GXZ24_05885 [Firmicutes bacterium]|nr:hypothetical protein [Bacillota bacterium]
MREFYAGSRRDVDKGFWMSFENHPRLAETKKKIYSRCVPCLEKLYEQLSLVPAPTGLILEEPLNCWKVVVVMDSEEECLSLLEAYQEERLPLPPSQSLRGRIGTRDKTIPGVAMIFHIHSEEQRDALFADLQRLAAGQCSPAKIFIECGCGDIYGALLGDWHSWQGKTPIKNAQLMPAIRERVARLLRGEY